MRAGSGPPVLSGAPVRRASAWPSCPRAGPFLASVFLPKGSTHTTVLIFYSKSSITSADLIVTKLTRFEHCLQAGRFRGLGRSPTGFCPLGRVPGGGVRQGARSPPVNKTSGRDGGREKAPGGERAPRTRGAGSGGSVPG